MSPIIINLDGDPRGKQRPRFTKQGGAYTPSQTRLYEEALAYAATIEMRGRTPIEGAVEVTVVVRKPIPTSWPKSKQAAARLGAVMATVKPDYDNVAKMVDALNTVVWRDDKQVVAAHIYKFYSDKPGLTIRVRELQGAIASVVR